MRVVVNAPECRYAPVVPCRDRAKPRISAARTPVDGETAVMPN
jgi:hypothetical protein